MPRSARWGKTLKIAAIVAAGTGARCSWALAAEGAATKPVAGSPSTAPATFGFNFKDAPIDAVVDFLSKKIGFAVLRDGAIDGKITIVSRQSVTAEQAITLLSAALKVDGFVIRREDGTDGRLLRISSRDKAKKDADVPVYFGSAADDVPDSDAIVTQVVPVQNISATKLRDDLKPLLSTDTDLAANEDSNTLLITDTGRAVRRLVRIISQLDEHQATTNELRIVQLHHANAAAAAKLLTALFKPASNNAGAPQQPGMPQPPQPGQGGSDTKHNPSVVAVADDRTNTVLVMASADTLKTVDLVLHQLDDDTSNPAPPAQIRAFPLRYAIADSTAKLVNDTFKPPANNNASPYFFFSGMSSNSDDDKKEVPVNAVPDERTNTVVVTAPPEKMSLVETLLHQLDTSPSATTDLQVFHLHFAQADDAAKVVTDMFEPPTNESDSNSRAYYFDVPPPEKEPKGVQVKVTSDLRTNTLLVSAPADLLKTIARVIKDLDSGPTSEDTLFIYHLRNSQASHLEYTLNVLFGNFSQNGGGDQQNGGANGAGAQGSNGGQQSSIAKSTSSFGNASSYSSTINRSRNSSSTTPRPSGGGSNIAQATNELTGKVLVVAEPDTNSLLVTTAAKYEKQVRAIIQELDHPVAQVLIKVLIAEVTHSNSDDLGVDFSVLNTRASGQGQSITSNLGNATAQTMSGGLSASVLESNVATTLHALATSGKLDVLSRPYILASDNQEANIVVGQIVPFITESRLDENNNTINTVQYQNIGIILDVTPHINPDGLVILDVAPQISALSTSQVSISNGVTSPVFDQRSANSRVGIMDGQTIVIGGLMQDQNTTTVQRIPLLGSIPFLGTIFSRNQVSKVKTELLIFLTPHVAAQAVSLQPMTDDEERGLRLTPNAIGPGIYDEHLRGLQRGAAPPATDPTAPTTAPSPVHSIDLGDPLNPN